MKIKFVFLLISVLASNLLHAQGGCSNVYYYDNDSDGYGTSAVFAGETNQNYGSGQYLGSWGQTINFPTTLNNLVSFNYSITNTAAMSQCVFRFYSGANLVASVESYPQNGETISTVYNFPSPLFGITSVQVFSYWNPAYLNGLTFLSLPSSVTACTQPAGYALSNTDCNDGNSAVNPGIFDICNSIDDNCDGQVDNGRYYTDIDGDGYGVNPGIITQANSTVIVTSTDIILNGSNDLNFNNGGTDIQSQISFVVPTTTTYTFNWSYVTTDPDGPELDPAYYINNVLVQLTDNVGNDSQSGSVSINVTAGSTFGFALISADGIAGQATLTISNFNGISNITNGVLACSAPVGYVANNSDCNDNLSSIHPGATEICNSFDDDCDSQVDDGVLTTYYADVDGDGYGVNPGITTQENSTVIVTNNQIIINGADNFFPFSAGNVQSNISFVVPQNATYTFNWSYVTTDEAPEFDPAYYINNTLVPLSNAFGVNSQSGSVSVAVTAGSTFGFAVVSTDGVAGSATLTITNFSGMSNITAGVSACSAPSGGYVANNDDCNDSQNNINPGAAEFCNLIDDDCDGQIDEGLNTYYADNDGDGFGAGPVTITCEQPVGFVLINGDCNDNSFTIKPSATELCNSLDDDCDGLVDDGVPLITRYLDNDGDGYGNMLSPSSNCFGTFPSNYVVNSTDCNDNLSAVNPAAIEVCNNIDDNCNAQIDEGVQGVFYADADGDGFGSSIETYACSLPTGFVANNADCNDGNSLINPGATEVCNTIDDNCDGQIDAGLNTYYADIDGDGFGAGAVTITCSPSAGFVLNNTDCNDNASAVYPGATEICNSIDDNCDTQIDEGVQNTYYVDTDGDGYGFDAVTESFAPGSWVLYTPSAFVLVGTQNYWYGVSNTIQFVAPTTETYTFNWAYAILDDPDQDPAYYFVNNQVVQLSNEWGALYQSGSVTVTVNAGDVFGFGINSLDDEAGPVWLEITNFNARPYMGIAIGCNQPVGYVLSNNDCNNSNAAVNPGATEICNSIDDNCDSEIDEGVQNTYYADTDGDGFGGNSTTLACTVPLGYSSNNLDCNENVASINPSASEICNSIDDNCNGQTDEGVQNTYYYDGDSDGFGTSAVFSGTTAQNYGAGQYLGSWGYTVNFPTTLNNLVSFNYSITNTAAMSQCVFRFYNEGNLIATVEAYPQNGETITTIYNFTSPLYNVTSVQVFSYWNPAYLNSLTFNSFPSSVSACTQPAGYASSNTDCNDGNAAVNPGAIEICNAIDDNCDSGIDNTLYYADADNDGYGDVSASGVLVCLAPSTYVLNNVDCNDANNIVYPGAAEVCNTIDDDCDSQIDEGVQNSYYADTDSDGYGAGSATLACAVPTGFVSNNTDCNNTNAAVNPVATEVCNSIDDDCNSQIDEGVQNNYYADSDGDGYGAGTATLACSAPTGFVSTSTDCNNTNASVNPGGTEVCNSIDDDCDTQIDEGAQNSYYTDADGDGYGSGIATMACIAPSGMVGNNTDCDDASVAVSPGATESCNSIDDDCDGGVDEFGTSPDAQVVTSCGPYTWSVNNTQYNSSGTYYANIPSASTFNSLASFASASTVAGYQISETEDFSEFWGYFTSAGGSLGAGFPSWSATGVSGFFAYQVNGSTAIAANQHSSALTFNFSSGVTGVGGNFFVSDVFGNVISNTVNITLSDGTTQSLWIASSNSFTGYISNGTPITSITINTPWISQTNPYVRVDNLVVLTGTPVISCSASVLQLTVNTPVSYFPDSDGDGYGAGAATLACTAPTGFVTTNTDCNNNNASVNPGATEVCNTIDDDCDSQIDEGVQNNYYVDTDGDGYGAGTATAACAAPIGYVITNTDCNNNNAAVNPVATEVCNTIDDDCDTQIDEGVQNNYYVDTDGDGYGAGTATAACAAPIGYVITNTDCNNNNAAVNPGATEVCNTIDDDCDTQIDEGLTFTNYYADVDGDGYGAGTATNACSQPVGFVTTNTDCNNNNASVNPGATEVCGNGADENCNGSDTPCVVLGCTDVTACNYNPLANYSDASCLYGSNFYADSDGDGYGAGTATVACTAPIGMVANNTDCNNANASIHPGATEICNMVDEDCDTQVDEGLPLINYYSDVDGDTYGGALVSSTCSILTGYVTVGGDCNDNNVAINPGAVEVCMNSIDDDCDGIVNDGCLPDQLLGESPATSQYVWTNFFPSCVTQSHTLTGFTPSLSSQSICLTGEDKWHYFTANSEAVSIQVASTANDILLELQNANGTLVATENAVAGLGGEILNFSGLTAGQIYKVGVRNYNSALGIGAYTICVKMLKRGGCDYGPGPYTLCQYFKAAFAGAGATYTFSFTGVSGPAAGNVYTRTQTSDICVLSNVSPALPYGSTYNVLITSTYNLLDGAGNSEIIVVPALSPCTMITTAQPTTALRTTDQCAAGPRFRGAIVASLPWVCGATNWRWEFTELNAAGQPVGLPIVVNRGAASNFITLSTVTQLQYGKTYSVRTAPILPYTGSNYQWGNPVCMSIVGSAAMGVEGQDSQSSSKVEIANEVNMSLYPNPTHGTEVNINLSGVESDNVQIRILDAMGKQVWNNRYAVNGILNTNITFERPLANGLYIVEAIYNGEVQTQRMMVQK